MTPPTLQDPADAQLAAQYETLPFPQRDPADEARRLITGSPGHLREVDYWVFGARRPTSKPLRVLVAGGGTGDATLMLAQQMASAGRVGEVTYLDRSAASMQVAKARAEARGLRNIVWKSGSILDLPGSGLGPFDYIDCCGVLHHMPDPAAGLAALVSVLAPGGGIGLLVYAPHGRTGVYLVQDALRLLAPPEQAPTARLSVARQALAELTDSNPLRRNPILGRVERLDDANLYDLLLNPRDRAYDVTQLFALIEGAGLRVSTLLEPARYDPDTYIKNPELRAKAAKLPLAQRAALAEAFCGNIHVHMVYCARASDPVVPPADPMARDAVPITREMSGQELARRSQPNDVLPISFNGLHVPTPLPPLGPAMLELIDGVNNVAEIAAELTSRGVEVERFDREWQQLWTTLNGLNYLLLAPPGA